MINNIIFLFYGNKNSVYTYKLIEFYCSECESLKFWLALMEIQINFKENK
jgi:hypothetical protein